MRTATAKGYQDARDYLQGFDAQVELERADAASWSFRVTLHGHTAQVLVPFEPTEAELRRVGQQVKAYFDRWQA